MEANAEGCPHGADRAIRNMSPRKGIEPLNECCPQYVCGSRPGTRDLRASAASPDKAKGRVASH